MRTRHFHTPIKLITAIIIFCSIFPTISSAKDKIHWGVRHFPPLYIHKGEYMDQGIVDHMLEMMFKNLPEYRHERVVGNNKSILSEIKKGKYFAKLAMLKNADREEYMYYSIPHYISPSHRLVIRKELLPKIQDLISDRNEISLESLLKRTDIRIGVELGRSVTRKLDEIIKKQGDQKNIIGISSTSTAETVQMLTDGEIDYIIEYPTVVAFILKREEEKLQTLEYLRIKEEADYVVAYAVAPKNEWGKTLIERINAVLRKEIPTEKYRSMIEEWLGAGDIGAFRAEYQKILVEGAKQ